MDTHGMWEVWAPVHGLNDAPAAFHMSLWIFVSNSAESLAMVGLKFQVSTFGPCAYFVHRKGGGSDGDITIHIDDVLGRGGPDALSETPAISEYRFGALKGPHVCPRSTISR